MSKDSKAFYEFRKPGFSERQSTKLRDVNKRRAILVDCGLHSDPKIMMLHQEHDHTLLGIFLEILFNLDFETKTWTIREDCFAMWIRKTFGVNNSFNILKRLKWISDLGLIEFRLVPDDFQMTSRLDPEGITLPFRNQSEQVETQAQSLSTPLFNTTQHNTNKEKAESNDSHFSLNKHEEDPKKVIWQVGVELLTSNGTSEQSARSFIGKQIRDYGEEAVLQTIEATKQANPVEPKSYMLGILKKKEILRPPERTPEEEEQQRWLNNRKQWLRIPYAVPTNRDDIDEIPIKSTEDYIVDSSDPPWIVRLKRDKSITLDIREWEPITYDQREKLLEEQEGDSCNYYAV